MSKTTTPIKGEQIIYPLALMLVGSIFAWIGIRGGTRDDGLNQKKQDHTTIPAESNILLNQALLDRGRVINNQSCAGCHSITEYLDGPSYTTIVHNALKDMSKFKSESKSEKTLVAVLSEQARHLKPTSEYYGRVPNTSALSERDRNAVAYWIAATLNGESNDSLSSLDLQTPTKSQTTEPNSSSKPIVKEDK